MLSQSQRTAILELHRKGVGSRQIARALKVSRAAVKKVIRSESSVPAAHRPSGEGGALPAGDPGSLCFLPGKPGPSP